MEFRDAVKYLRSELGLTQVELAMGLNINAVTVGRWENGRTLPNRSITATLMEYAKNKGASKKCLDILTESITSAAKEKLELSGEGLYAVEHSSLSQLIDDASFPIYVCDMETDELLYLNQKACSLFEGGKTAIGKKCFECFMRRDTPCDFCHKNELTDKGFNGCDVLRPLDGTTYHVQGKLIRWNGRRAQVRYILEKGAATELASKEEAFAEDLERESAKLSEKAINDENDILIFQVKTIFDNISGGVSVAFYEGNGEVRLGYANDQYYKLFGYTKEQYGKELKGSHDTVHPDDWDRVADIIKKIKETRQGTTFRYRIIKRDKSIAYLRCNSSVIDVKEINGYAMISILTDITESVSLEQQAIITGKRLDAIMNNMNNAVSASVVRTDGTSEFLFTNDRYYGMLGYTREQFQSEVKNPCQCIYSEDIDKVREAVFGTNKIGDEKKLFYRAVRKDGKIIWLRARISMVTFPDADGPVQLAVYQDVTDIIEAQEKLAVQHAKIEGILNDTPSGIAIVELNLKDIPGTMRTVYYNDRFISYSGYDRDEYDALLKNNEMAFVFNEDIPSLLNSIQKLCSGEVGTSSDTVVRCHTKDGGFRWLILTAQLAEKQGNDCTVNVAMIDITERQIAADRQRISEEMLRIAAETDKRIVVIYDIKNKTCRVESRKLFSSKYGDIFNNVPQGIIDKKIVAPESEKDFRAMFERIKNGERNVNASLQLQSGPNIFEWFECNATTVFDSEGNSDHAVLVFHNIMEQRVKEAVFKKWQQSIEAREPESYTLFRCNLSRDASIDEREGSLLNVVFSPDDLSFNGRTKQYADEYVYPDDRNEYIKLLDADTLISMFYRGEHASSLDYRETSENGEMLWRRLTVEMVEYPNSTDIQAFLMFEDIDEDKKAEIAEKEIANSDPLTGALNRSAFTARVNDIISENPNSNCAMIMLDMDGFKKLNDTFGHAAGDQALQEVVSVLHSFARSGDLVGRLGGDEFVVWLREVPYDAVIGKIAQQMCDHIRKAYSKDVSLSASAGIAVYPRDGGSYEELYHNADSALYKAKRAGKSCCSFFSVVGEEQTEQIEEALSEVKQLPRTERNAKRRILIVDDNKTNRLVLKNIFKDDYLIETAKNGAEALILLRHFGVSISVVLLDLFMPGVDGFSVLRSMQKDTDMRTIPVIIVTGDEDHSTLLKAFELGAAEYVAKPIDVDIIRMRVKAVISKAESERLRAQNSYLMLQRNEEMKYRTVLESTGTVVVEYDWRNHVFIYDGEIAKRIAGNYDHRGLWQIFLSDMVAESSDAKMMQDALIGLASNRNKKNLSMLVKLKTPEGEKHWFRMSIYKSVDDFGLAENLFITFNDVNEEVLANDKLLFQATRDELTGLYNRAGFFEKAAELIVAEKPGYYVMSCIDIEKFQVINDQYGTEKGDEVLKHIASNVDNFVQKNKGIACRYTADKFAVMYPAKMRDTNEIDENHRIVSAPGPIPRPLRLRMGRCIVDDKTLPVSTLFDRAAMAETLAKGHQNTSVVYYDDSMRDALINEQRIVGSMADALENGEFEPWLQPQYNHATGALIGAEALVRWRRDGKIIPPDKFVPIFEKNGFIYEVDQSIWRQVCALLRRWIDEGKNPLPVSVNISRQDMFQDNFVGILTDLIAEYNLPAELLRLEITESAFSADTSVITDIAGKLVAAGFTLEIDDFGSGYSSLNTLKDVPASILKLDMRFFETTENSAKGGNIVESVVRMAKWLGMAVIAEGVEEKEQADYLKSIGCNYIQGYYYSKPIPVDEYEKRMHEGIAEHRMTNVETIETLDANLFWDPKSMETLIFNSYVGGACIFEYDGEKTELLRFNEQYITEMNGLIPEDAKIEDISIVPFLDEKNNRKLTAALKKARDSGNEASTEYQLTDGGQTEYIRQTIRVIAKAENRTLYYSVIQNQTRQRELERDRAEIANKLSVIMNNVNGGVSAIEIDTEKGTSSLVFHNDKYYELYGYSRAENKGEEPDPLSFIIPKDFPMVMEKVKKLEEDGKPAVIDYGITKKDGNHAQIRANVSLMSLEGYGPIIASVLTDITEQRTMEEQLRAIIDNINGGVTATYISGNNINYVLSNDKYYEILGYSREQFNNEIKSVFDLIHPDDRERVKKIYKESVEAGKPYTMEYRIIRRNGTVRNILCNANILDFFGVKEPVQLSVFNDVTLLRESQNKEQSLTRRMEAIMQNVDGGVTATVYHDENHVELAFANEGYYELFGYTKDQLEKEHPNVIDLVYPEDRERTMATVAKIVSERSRITYEYRCVKRDGSIIWIQSTNSVVSLSDLGDTVLLAVLTDITALRRSEEERNAVSERLSAVMNAMTNGMSAIAFSGRNTEFLFANDQYYALHGVTKESCGDNKLFGAMRFVHADDRKLISKVVMETNEIGKTAEVEYRVVLPNGKTRWINAEISITTLAGVDMLVQVAAFTDITDKKKAAEQVRFLNESAGEILAQPDSNIGIQKTLEGLLAYFAAERTYIFELNDKTRTTDNTYEICAEGVHSEIENLKHVPYDTQQYWFDAFDNAGFLAIPDVAAIEEKEKAMREILLAQDIRSIIVAPLRRDGKLIGYIGADNPTKAVDQVGQLIALSDYVAVLLTRRDLVKTIKQEHSNAQQLMDDVPGGFIRMEIFEDRNPAVVTVNSGICEMLGMTRDEVLEEYGSNVLACLVDEDALTAPNEIKQAYEAGKQYTSTCRIKKKDGEIFWAMLFGRFIEEEDGKLYLNAYFTDISEKKSIEQLQIELLENLPSGAALYEFDGEKIRAIHINKHYWKLVGRSALSPEETARFGVFHPDDRKIVSEELKAAIRQGRNAVCTARIICGDGSYMPFSIVTNNVREKNGNYLLYATFSPISDEEMAVQKMLPVALSTIVSNTDDMSYVKDKELRYVCVSQSVAEMAGVESPRDLIGKTAGEAFDIMFAEKFDKDDMEVLKTGKPSIRALEHIPTKDGSICLARTTKFPILDASGSAIGVYCISHDITAQKERESQLELLTETIPGGLAAYSLSKEGIKTLYFNDGFYSYSGYTREEYTALTEKEPLYLMLPEDRQSVLDMLRDFEEKKEDGMTGTCSYRCRTKDGDIRWMSLKSVLSKVGEETYVLNAVQLDITEQMSEEKRQSDLLDNLPFGAAMYEFDGKTLKAIHINKQYSKMVNREIDITSANYVLTDAIHPDDRKAVILEIRSAIAEKRNAACDIRLLCGEDEFRLFHLDARIVSEDNGKFMLYVAYEQITDKEKEFKETSERLKLLSDSIPGGIATFRCMPGSIEPIYFNDGICNLTGYSRKELERGTITILDLIFDEDKLVIRKQIELLMGGATALDYFVRIHIKDGGYKWVECAASVTGHESETVFLVSAVITDVTEHQEERERLRVSEELNRIAIDQSGKIIGSYDVAKRTMTLPYTLPDIYNLPRVLENMPYEQVELGRISPDTAEAYCSVFERINRGEASGEATYKQNSSIGWRWLKSKFTTVYANDGTPLSAVITYEDVTEQRDKEAIYTRWQNAMSERSEDSYTLIRCNLNKPNIFDSWNGSLIIVNRTEKALPFNTRAKEYTERFVYPDDREAFRSFLNSDTMLAEYHRGHRSDSIDYREQDEEGNIRWLRLTVDLVEYPDSTDVEAYLLYENIDEQKHAELSVIHRAETDPLTGVLNRTAFAERVNRAIDSFGKQTQHALFIFDVDGFKRVNDSFGHGAGDQTLTDIAAALPRVCRKDDIIGRLGGDEFFVFLENIGSAEAAERKARQLCDLTRKSLSADVHISVSIGIALHPQDGEDFDALYKAADDALYRTKNAGKDGYSFSYGDPVVDTGNMSSTSQSAVQTSVKKINKKRRVLIVDDNRIAQATLEAILRNDYSIEKASDGQSALQILHHYSTAISAVLLDLVMPGMDGFDVLKKMQQDEETAMIPVIVVSADEDTETALRVIRAGAYDLVKKPVDADLLRIRVESAISKSENERLRVQNSYLALCNTEVNSYRAALERMGTMVITLDWAGKTFSYSPAVSKTLAGKYDMRPLWEILYSDDVTDEETAKKIRQLVENIENDSEQTEGSIQVRLKTRKGLYNMFELNLFKDLDDFGISPKMIMTLNEASSAQKKS